MKRTWIKAVIISLIGVALLVTAVILLNNSENAAYQSKRGEMSTGFGQLKVVEWNGVKYREKPKITTILLCGIDKPDAVENADANDYRNGGQADFIMLVAIDHTDKKIKNMIEDLDRDTVMVLVNAITFDGKWEEPYEKESVYEGEFYSADGTLQAVTFLSETSNYYFESDKATGFMKNYKGGEYAFLAILPKDDSISANEFAKSFTSKDYEDFISSRTTEYTVYSKMPEFKSDFKLLMNDTIKNLGAGDIFMPGTADFSGISGAKGDIYVSMVLHQTHIEVDAQGTKASAATVVSMTKNAVEGDFSNDRYVICDRPYVYAIVDTKTMAPVFVGTVNKV